MRFERGFRRGPLPTIGLEKELILVDPDSFGPVDAIESVLVSLEDDKRFKRELRVSQLEHVTPMCLTVKDATANSRGHGQISSSHSTHASA